MNSYTDHQTNLERFYALLPEVYRVYDYQQGLPLKALLEVVFEQVEALRENMEQLYDDQFIETCSDWVVPYIGDLIGYRALHGVTSQTSSPRADVANTLRNRRRKGPAATLESLAFDVTGWKARAVEFFQRLATSQYMNHIRLENRVTPELRDAEALLRFNSPFESYAHSLDVRRIVKRRGRYNIPNVGIFLWRLEPFSISQGTAFKVAPGCYTFHPLGLDQPLFNLPAPEASGSHLADPTNVPEPLQPLVLFNELEKLRTDLATGDSYEHALSEAHYFGSTPRFQVFVPDGDAWKEIPPEEVSICYLSDPPTPIPEHWHRPADKRTYPGPETSPGTTVDLPISVGVDPQRGRVVFPSGVDPDEVLVSYTYAFSARSGGGEYPRQVALDPDRRVPEDHPSLSSALTAQGGSSGVIEVQNSRTWAGDLTVNLSPQQRLTLQARDGTRPVLDGMLTVQAADDSQLILDGLWIAGGIQVLGTQSLTLVVQHCSLPPYRELDGGQPKPPVQATIGWDFSIGTGESRGKLVLDHSIAGRLEIGTGVQLEILDSMVDALSPVNQAIVGSSGSSDPVGRLVVRRSTVIGGTHALEIDVAEDSLFDGELISDRRQMGCVRFSYLPPGSSTPKRFTCQPETAEQEAISAARKVNPGLTRPQADAIAVQVQARVEPLFTSNRWQEPGYLQLSLRCPLEIRTGAESGAEMGAFERLYQPQRETNLHVRLEEYLRFGLEAGIFFVT